MAPAPVAGQELLTAADIVRFSAPPPDHRISYGAEAKSARIVDEKSGEILPSIIAYWFAWASFHPDASVYGSESQTSQ